MLTERAAGSLVLLNLEAGDYFTLDQVGIRIWDLCDGAFTVGEIVAAVSREYEADEEMVRTDTLELLTELAKQGLLLDGR